jgi:tetraacyldisaccharide-1-P 4'-kinase
MAKASLHQQVVIKTEKDLMRLKEILSKNVSMSNIAHTDVKFGVPTELYKTWGINAKR